MDPLMDVDSSMVSNGEDDLDFSPHTVFGADDPQHRQFGRTLSYDENTMANTSLKTTNTSPPAKHPNTSLFSTSTPTSSTASFMQKSVLTAFSPAAVVYNLGRFGNDFDVLTVLGEGTFGIVYSARQKMDGIDYAVKKAKRRFHGDQDRDNMLIEIHACSKLSAGSEDAEVFSIVRYFGAWIEDEYVFLQMELCEISIEGLLSAGYRFNVPETFLVLRHVLLALKFLHQHAFVHLDVKPANILRKGEHFKLGDFGLARRFFQQGHVTSGVEEGDSRYLAAELLEWNVRDKDLTKADIFSTGITAYEMVTMQKLPQNGDVWHKLRTNCYELLPSPGGPTQELVDVIRSLMNSDPAQRPSAGACISLFLSLASEKDKEIYRLQLQNEALKSQLDSQKSTGLGRLKRHHSIL